MAANSDIVTLADVAYVVMGQSPAGDTYNNLHEGVPLLNGPTEFGPSHPAPVLWTTAPTKLCQPGDFLFCVRGSTTGRMNWADQSYCIGRGLAAIRAKAGSRDTRFVYYTLVNGLPRLLSRCVGSVFPNLSSEDFNSFQISWPEPGIRSAITTILGTLDDKIDLNRRMNETLETMARALFKSWFVDFDPVRAKAAGHQPAGMDVETAALFPDGFEESPLGEIPRGWKVRKVGDLASINREGINPGDYPNEVFEHFSIPAFDEGRLPKAESGEQIKSNKFVVPSNAILLSKLNPRIPRVWLPALSGQYRSACSTEFLVILPKSDVGREYLYAYLSSASFLELFTTLVTGTSSSHQRVRPEDMLSMEIVSPSQAIIGHFSTVTKPLYRQVAQNRAQSQALTATRDALLPKLLSGEIHVKEAEKLVEAKI